MATYFCTEDAESLANTTNSPVLIGCWWYDVFGEDEHFYHCVKWFVLPGGSLLQLKSCDGEATEQDIIPAGKWEEVLPPTGTHDIFEGAFITLVD